MTTSMSNAPSTRGDRLEEALALSDLLHQRVRQFAEKWSAHYGNLANPALRAPHAAEFDELVAGHQAVAVDAQEAVAELLFQRLQGLLDQVGRYGLVEFREAGSTTVEKLSIADSCHIRCLSQWVGAIHNGARSLYPCYTRGAGDMGSTKSSYTLSGYTRGDRVTQSPNSGRIMLT